MSIDPKTLTVFLDDSPSGMRRAVHAATLARRWGAHLIGAYAVFEGFAAPSSATYAFGSLAIQHAIAYEQRQAAAAEAAAARVGGHFRDLCTRLNVSGEFRPIRHGKMAQEAVRNSLYADLAIVGHPAPHGLPVETSPEKILLATGVPLLVVPNAWEGNSIGTRILIGWNGSKEARRAVADAMTFLVAAEFVTVLVIDPLETASHEEPPGADIGRHLVHHCVRACVQRGVSRGAPIAQVILRRAVQSMSDLLVVGAYSHARLREIFLGGTTRTLLAQMPIPVLISR